MLSFSVRLVGGATPLEGRVEVYSGGVWGTVCDDFWEIADANVVCRQLGYPGAEEAFSQAHFGEGEGAILLDNVDCNGSERDLLDCTSIEHNCAHSEDAGVRCANNCKFLSFCSCICYFVFVFHN